MQQLSGVSYAAGANVDTTIPGGAVDPAAIILATAEPMFSLSTNDLSTLLAGVSLDTGLKCTANSVFYFQRRDDGAVFLGSTSHVKALSAAGFAMVNGISMPHGQPAEANFSYYAWSSDGLANPIAWTDSQSLVAQPAFNSKFFLADVYYTASPTQLVGVTNVSFDNGMSYRNESEDGCVYPLKGTIRSRTRSLSITCHRASVATVIAPHQSNSAVSTLTVRLRAGSSGSTRIADATTAHITLAFPTTGVWRIDSASGSGSDDVSVSIKADCIGLPTLNLGVALA